DPRLRFANGQTTANFTLPAGSTRVTVPLVSTGTVASTVTVSVANLRSAGSNLSLFPTSKIFGIAPSAPVVTSACYKRTQTGIALQLNGYSTTRELVRADVAISTQNFQTDLSGIAAGYFSDPQTIRAGGSFALTVPYDDLNLDPKAPPPTVGVNVLNTVGAEGNQTIQACQ